MCKYRETRSFFKLLRTFPYEYFCCQKNGCQFCFERNEIGKCEMRTEDFFEQDREERLELKKELYKKNINIVIFNFLESFRFLNEFRKKNKNFCL